MKHNILDNFGQRAYNDVQLIKKQILKDEKIYKASDKCSRFKIFGSYSSLTKSMYISGNDCKYVVKMVYDNVNKYSNCVFEIKCNNILVYSGGIPYTDINLHIYSNSKIDVSISSNELIDYDISLELYGKFDSYIVDEKIELLNSDIYIAYAGIGETIVIKYNSADNIASGVVESYYIIPITLFDIKTVKDSNCFVGANLVVLGVNDSNELVYYISSNNFTEANIIPVENFENAVVCPNANCMAIYFTKSGNLYVGVYDANQNFNVEKIPFSRNFKFVQLYSSNNCTSSNIGLNMIIARASNEEACLIVHSGVGVYSRYTFMYLGLIDNASISHHDDYLNIYISYQGSTNKKQVKYLDQRFVFLDATTYTPCSLAIDIADKTLLIYNRSVTVI